MGKITLIEYETPDGKSTSAQVTGFILEMTKDDRHPSLRRQQEESKQRHCPGANTGPNTDFGEK